MAYSTNVALEIIRQYLTKLQKNNIPIDKAILYGSYAKGQAREDSDIDVAVISSVFAGNRFADRKMIVRFRRGIDSKIEPMPFSSDDYEKGGVLIDEIKKTGKQIDF